ncbi:MAG: hypothetical protein HY656_07090 [Acidobacteria bacterium]|nr:hypothetical protein [Acidobacteriota bacterium]
MPDWRALTAEHLAGLDLPEARQQEILQELSEHLEDEFAVLRERLPEAEAQRQARNLLAESEVLVREIRKAEKEDPMKQAARIFLGGMLTGGIWGVLTAASFVFVLGGTEEFLDAVEAAPNGPLPPILYMAIGIWTMWLCAAIRPRYGPGPKTAVIASFAVWLIGTLVDALLVSFGLVSLPASALLAPVAVSLPVIIAGAVAGAWASETHEPGPSRTLTPA